MAIHIETSQKIKKEKLGGVIFNAKKNHCQKTKNQDGFNVVKLVSEISNVPVELFFHHSRCKSHIADARQLAMYLLHVSLGNSMNEVGRFFGRDRTTVSHACARIEDKRDDLSFDEMVCELEDRLEEISLNNC